MGRRRLDRSTLWNSLRPSRGKETRLLAVACVLKLWLKRLAMRGQHSSYHEWYGERERQNTEQDVFSPKPLLTTYRDVS